MATPPVFSAGAVLTAGQMNAVGLWRVTSCTVSSTGGTAATASNGVITIGNGNTVVTVSDAFSADFDNYLIKISGGGISVDDNTHLQFGSTTTGYYGNLVYATFASPGTIVGAGDNNAAQFSFVWRGTTTSLIGDIFVTSPYLTEQTFVEGSWIAGSAGGRYQGYIDATTSYTSFKVKPASGSLTGGTIRVYGYRN